MADLVESVRDRIGSSVRDLLAGRTEARARPADGGLFGPDSATWQVHSDSSMLIGGIRALLMQTLHPPTMAGVADHSNYRSDPLGRLQRTGSFIGATTFGSVAEAEQSIATVRAVHDHVVGTTPDGLPYRANDPHLLGWVHATEVDSFLRARRGFGSNRINDRVADQYVSEMAVVGEKLGVEDAPRSMVELEATLQSYLPELGLNHQSRQALWFITFPPLPLAARAPYAVLYSGAISSLPRWCRRKLWIPKLPVTETLAIRPASQTLCRLLDWSLSAPVATGQ